MKQLYESVIAFERIVHLAKKSSRVKVLIKLGANAFNTPFNRIKLPNHATFVDASVTQLSTPLGLRTAHVVDSFSASWLPVRVWPEYNLWLSLNTSRPSDANMRTIIYSDNGLSAVRRHAIIMIIWIPTAYHHLNPWKHISLKFESNLQ